uniref:Uncharacterized protein n=1 Tax=Arundo donax TaxID=35708 RepID=A0A0A8XN76_ARUDO
MRECGQLGWGSERAVRQVVLGTADIGNKQRPNLESWDTLMFSNLYRVA